MYVFGSSVSSFGEYSADSPSTAGAYSCFSELSLATLVRLLLSMLVRLCSVDVRRLSVGEVGGKVERCWSRLERPDWRLRGGGGGGGMEAELSLETERGALRFEFIEDVRWRPGAGEDGSDDNVVRREEGGLGDDTVGRRAVAVEESSVEDEFALEVLIVDNAAPWRLVGGGGGGAFCEGDEVGASWLSPGLRSGSSREC